MLGRISIWPWKTHGRRYVANRTALPPLISDKVNRPMLCLVGIGMSIRQSASAWLLPANAEPKIALAAQHNFLSVITKVFSIGPDGGFIRLKRCTEAKLTDG